MKQYCVGIDVGGTSVKCGIFSINGVLMHKWEVPTRKEEQGAYILQDVAEALNARLAEVGLSTDELSGIGIGVPGPVLPDGFVEVCVNLGWRNRYPAREMSELMGGRIPCRAGNDANVAALGEMWQGGGKGYQDVMAITLGTGVGGGVIVGGHMLAGAHGLGGEIGHIHVRDEEPESCNCGARGCLEQVASATGFAREARRKLASSGADSMLRRYGDKVSAKDLFDCAKAGDALALETVDTCCRYLGIALASAALIVDPEIFVIGGGVSKAGAFLIECIEKHYDKYAVISKKRPIIGLATLGNDAGIYGAARLVLES